MNHNFSPSQQEGYDKAQTGGNVFITGSAGNGKSYLVERLITPNTAVFAPTGIAALNVGGVTCHRGFGIPPSYPDEMDFNTINAKARKVLLCANDLGGEFVNGDTGVILNISNTGLEVKLVNGKIVQVPKFEWQNFGYSYSGGSLEKEVVGSFIQYPVKLGWAISIHKSQGITLDDVAIHTGRGMFSHGQFYIGGSRVRDLTRIQFLRKHLITQDDLICKNEVYRFYHGTDNPYGDRSRKH